MKFETKAVHSGYSPDPWANAVMPPVYQTSTYAQDGPGIHKGYEYSRIQNPTREVLESALAALENGRKGFCYSSGMAAIDAILKLLRPGDEVVASEDLYGGTFRMMKKIFEPYGIIFHFTELRKPENFKNLINTNTRLVWMETPSNPLLRITDIAKISHIARENGILSSVDSTFASPYLCRPLELGVDVVMHSATKYLGGHSDVIMGALIVNDEGLAGKLAFQQKATGAVPGPQDCYLVFRGLKTLHLRMRQHCENALRVATWLSGHGNVRQVYYPGLPSHPEHELAAVQMKDFGGMVSFEINGSVEDTLGVMKRMKLFTVGESLGGVESLCAYPAMMSHASFSAEERQKIGVTDNLIRLSVGVENIDDIIADLEEALR